MLGQGERTAALEQRVASWLGAAGGVAASSGSAALLLALRSLNIRSGDEVIVPTYVCRSVAESVHAAGAAPRFCDSGSDWVVTADEVRRAVRGRTKAVIVPHLYGIFADTAAIRSALRIPVIEDFAQAFPGERSRVLEGDIGMVSFHPTKCLTSGEGGVAISARADHVSAMRRIRDGGQKEFVGRQFSPFSDLAAALVSAQLDRYAEFLARRASIAKLYTETLSPVCREWLPRQELLNAGMHFRFTLRVPGGLESVESAFRAAGVTVRRGVDELLHRVGGEPDTNFPVAVRQFDETISLPIRPSMTMEETRQVADAASRILRAHRGA